MSNMVGSNHSSGCVEKRDVSNGRRLISRCRHHEVRVFQRPSNSQGPHSIKVPTRDENPGRIFGLIPCTSPMARVPRRFSVSVEG